MSGGLARRLAIVVGTQPTLLLAGLLALTACGGSGGSGGGGAAAVSKWDAADACKTLDKAAVTAATGQQVKSEELTSSTPDSGNGVAMSMCTYTLANDAIMALMTRVSDAAFTDADIAGMRAAIPDSAPVAGLGMQAFWSPMGQTLQVFPDRKSYMSLAYHAAMTLPGTPPAPGPDPKTALTAAAKGLL